MKHLKDRAYELMDKALRKLDGIPSKKDQLSDRDATSVRAFIERSRELWVTPTQVYHGMDGVRKHNVISAILRLRDSGEVIESAVTDQTNLEARFTTLKHFHDVAPMKSRIRYVVTEILGGLSKDGSRV